LYVTSVNCLKTVDGKGFADEDSSRAATADRVSIIEIEYEYDAGDTCCKTEMAPEASLTF
jgi:hypothetical protein